MFQISKKIIFLVCLAGGPIFRLKGSILTMSFLDCNGALIPYSYESWKDDSKDVSIHYPFVRIGYLVIENSVNYF